jgi:hypothetical protein
MAELPQGAQPAPADGIQPGVVPPSVLKAAKAAEALHKAAYTPPQLEITNEPPADTPKDPGAEPAPKDATPPEPAPVDPAASKQPASGERERFDNPDATKQYERYLAMKGRYDQSHRTVGELQEQLDQTMQENLRLQNLVRRAPPAPRVPAPPPQPKNYLTDADVKEYGHDVIDLAKRAAKEAIEPELLALREENKHLKQLNSETAHNVVIEMLSDAVPNWAEINKDPKFKAWMRSEDFYSGRIRQEMLNEAAAAHNARRVIAFYKGFLTEQKATGHVPDPQTPAPAPAPAAAPTEERKAAIDLKTLAAPGKPRPSSGGDPATASTPDSKPIITRAQIKGFYDSVRRGDYNGRKDDYNRDQAIIFSAQAEGRIR